MYYGPKRYTAKRVKSRLANFLWSLVLMVATLMVLALCAYGCSEYLKIMGTEV